MSVTIIADAEFAITAADCKLGQRGDENECPVARAVRRGLRHGLNVTVGDDSVAISEGNGFVMLRLPDDEVARIAAYDQGGAMEPHTLTLAVPERFL